VIIILLQSKDSATWTYCIYDINNLPSLWQVNSLHNTENIMA